MTVAPSALPNALAEVLAAVATNSEQALPEAFAGVEASAVAEQIAASLLSGERVAVLLGNMAVASNQAALIAANATALAQAAHAKFGIPTPGARIGQAAWSERGGQAGAITGV